MPVLKKSQKQGFMERNFPPEFIGRGLDKLTMKELEYLAWAAIPDYGARVQRQREEQLRKTS